MLCVRQNHMGLHDRMEVMFALERAGDFAGCSHDDAETVGKDHGRIGIRHPLLHFQPAPEAKLLLQAVQKHWSTQPPATESWTLPLTRPTAAIARAMPPTT